MRVSTTIFILFIFISVSTAQVTYQGPADGSVSSGMTVNTNNFADAGNSFGSESNFRIINNVIPNFVESIINFADSLKTYRTDFILQPSSVDRSDSIYLSKNFEGIPQTNSIPPDDYIAAGPNHIMMVVNSVFRIFDKDGNVIKTINANNWFSGLINNLGPFDPKVIYDQYNGRWVMVWLNMDSNQNKSYYLISVSDDDDPTGTWFNWALPADVNGSTPANNWADYQGVGFDENAIYLTSNQFSYGGYYQYVKLRIIDNTNIYINSNPGTVTWKDIWSITIPGLGTLAYNIRPVRMYSQNNDYLLFNLPTGSGNYCSLYKLNNPINSPQLSGSNIPITTYYNAPNAQQLGGGSLLIEAGGAALRNEPVYKDGNLFAVHSIANPNNILLSSINYLEIKVSDNSVVQDISMGDNEHYFFYPALAVDQNDNVIISYSRSSANEYVGGYYTMYDHQSGVPSGSITLKPGNANYVKDYGSGRNRWGDYSGAWIDPVDSNSFWICIEYVEALNTWGTWVGNVNYTYPLPVELKSFNANINKGKVLLKWKVASEVNNFGFEIDRKNSSGSYDKLGFINGRGTSTEEKTYFFNDISPLDGISYYKLVQIDLNGKKNNLAEISIKVHTIPKEYSLSQNYPNPFNPVTTIKYEIPENTFVSLKVYDINGREVAALVNGYKNAGKYQVKFDGSNLASGVYLYKFQADNFLQTKKFILLK